MSFQDLANTLASAVVANLYDPCTYITINGAVIATSAAVLISRASTEGDHAPQASEPHIRLELPSADVPQVRRGDTAAVNGITYTVEHLILRDQWFVEVLVHP